MPSRPRQHRPPGWKPAVKVADPHYSTTDWKAKRERIKTRDRWRCTAPDCATPDRGAGGRLIVDHILERKRGGSDDDDNLRTLCPACDNRRHADKAMGPRL